MLHLLVLHLRVHLLLLFLRMVLIFQVESVFAVLAEVHLFIKCKDDNFCPLRYITSYHILLFTWLTWVTRLTWITRLIWIIWLFWSSCRRIWSATATSNVGPGPSWLGRRSRTAWSRRSWCCCSTGFQCTYVQCRYLIASRLIGGWLRLSWCNTRSGRWLRLSWCNTWSGRWRR